MKTSPEIKKLDRLIDFYWKFYERPKRYLSSWYISFLLKFKLTPAKYRNEYSISKFVNKNRFEIVIGSDGSVQMLLGWTDKEEDDLFYILWDSKYRGIIYDSCVGKPIPLKGRLPRFKYYSEKRIWFWNNPTIEAMLKEVEKKGIVLL